MEKGWRGEKEAQAKAGQDWAKGVSPSSSFSPVSSSLLSHLSVALDPRLDLEGVGPPVEVDVHDGGRGGAAMRGERALPVGELWKERRREEEERESEG